MRISSIQVALVFGLVVACRDESDPAPGGAGSGAGDGGSMSSGSPVTGASPSVDGGATTGGVASRLDGSASSSSGNAAGSAGGGGATDASAPAGDGGSPTTSADASGSGSAPGGGDAGSASGCTRELLKATVDAYFKALAAHDPAMLPLADNVKFTENGKTLKLGEAGLWQSAGALKHAHSALDTEACQAASQAVVPDGTMDIPVALRLKLQNQKLTEIETIAVRPGDYTAFGSPFPSDTRALAASNTSVKWEEPVAAAQRNTRAEITGWIDKYFRMFPRGVCSVASSCKRIENGGGNFNCSSGASCAAGPPAASDNALRSRLLLADVETGVGVGFTMFMGNTDMHMYKMYGGQIYVVSAILGRAESSGWE